MLQTIRSPRCGEARLLRISSHQSRPGRGEYQMLHEFVTVYGDAIIARAREKVAHRRLPPVSASELENGVPVFLTQLSETLRCEATASPPHFQPRRLARPPPATAATCLPWGSTCRRSSTT